MSNWRDLADRLDGKAPPNARRSSEWSSFRDQLLRGRECEVCGGKRFLVGHHKIPFHLAPDLELDPTNIAVLCESGRFGINCHLLIGHLGNWQRTNMIVDADIAYWRERIINSR